MVDPALLALHFRASGLPVTLTLPFGSTATSQPASLSEPVMESFTLVLSTAQAASFGEQQVFLLLLIVAVKAAVPSTASTWIGAPVSFRTQNASAGPAASQMTVTKAKPAKLIRQLTKKRPNGFLPTSF